MAITGDVALEAQYLLLRELISLNNARHAINWADDLIRQSDVPEIEIIDLSMVSPGDKKGLISALEALACPVRSSRQLANAFLVRLRSEMASTALTPRQVAEMLYYFRSRCSVLTSDEDMEFSIATDKLEIAEQYFGNLDQATQDFSTFLARYG